jgi:asparagine synthase (glutamine-hydrolysing)
VLERMTDAIEHRGPNDSGTHVAEGVAIGARRLSIVDVEGGHQPFSDERGEIWAVQNGELYNHATIRKGLERSGHHFRSRCDTEILPHLYEELGPAFPSKLRGMFAIAVYDTRRRRGVIARDRLGIKPLYYSQVGDLLVFASELKSLLASGLIEPALDYDAVDAYLSLGYFSGPATPIAGVSKLMPGTVLVADPAGVRTETYWRYPEPQVTPGESVDSYGERLIAALDESVKLRLMSDVPLGAMLSGGLDSSLIVALMARHMSEPVKTFSVGFAGDTEGNELSAARRVASALGADHHELELSHDSGSVSLERLVWHLDEPVASLSALGFYGLSELASRHVTVALSGQGADEQLGGYRKHLAASFANAAARLPAPLGRAAQAVAGTLPDDRLRRVLAATEPTQRLLASSGRLSPSERARLVRGPLQLLDGRAAERAVSARGGRDKSPLEAALFLDGQLALVDDMLHYFDRASMAHSLEVRVPFLDHEVVELCATIPAGLKVRRLTTKYLLRRVARGIVPDDVISRPKVSFFHRNLEQWFRGQMGTSARDYLTDPSPRYAEFLDRHAVSGLADDYFSGRAPRQGHFLLAVLMLEVWLSTFLPRATGVDESTRILRLTA